MAAIEPYTLIAPQNEEVAYLINQDGEIVHNWDLTGATSTSSYLLPEGHLMRTVKVQTEESFGGGGSGGRVERLDWDGNVLWSFELATMRYRLHHDIAVLPNGNVLVLSWERLTPEETLALGRAPDTLPENDLWAETIIELKPVGESDSELVWQWRLADHTVQDIDATKSNFGVIADHPERVNINYNKGGRIRSDWIHANAINYSEKLDQIVISAHAFNEIWVIDHSTTTEEAATGSGGNSGKGGDLLYRWGNPRTYQQGDASDQKLFNQHDAEWIPEHFPGAGRILLFNNGIGRPEGDYSTVNEIITPIDADGHYLLDPSGRYGPEEPATVYQAEMTESFLAVNISGSQRLRNGNTLITNGPVGQVFEVTADSEIVWEYDSREIVDFNRRVFRADRHYLSALPPTGMVVDQSISGNWYDPDRSGEGYVIEVLDDGRVALVWFTFPPDATETDQQAWMIGVGYLEGDHIVVDRMQTQKGTVFGSGFNMDDIETTDWGRVEMVFDDCDVGGTDYSGPPAFGQGFLPMQRLTAIHGHSCPSAGMETEQPPDNFEATLASEAASGAFYQPERTGEGWLMEYLGDGQVAVQWFTYNPDGNAARLTGLGRINGSRVIVEQLVYVTGTEFGSKFNPDDIDVMDWGSMTFEFFDCDNGSIVYFSRTGGWESGTVDVTRLTSIKGSSCSWPPADTEQVDDRTSIAR
jgi:hypothetical protein